MKVSLTRDQINFLNTGDYVIHRASDMYVRWIPMYFVQPAAYVKNSQIFELAQFSDLPPEIQEEISVNIKVVKNNRPNG